MITHRLVLEVAAFGRSEQVGAGWGWVGFLAFPSSGAGSFCAMSVGGRGEEKWKRSLKGLV